MATTTMGRQPLHKEKKFSNKEIYWTLVIVVLAVIAIAYAMKTYDDHSTTVPIAPGVSDIAPAGAVVSPNPPINSNDTTNGAITTPTMATPSTLPPTYGQ